jgi:glyoxylase-like metal-dependent hydrolase (beta-lactamase superfamily II)
MILQSLVVGALAVNCYILADEHTREALVIDAGGNPREILNALKQHRLRVLALVNTHAHFDHVLGIDALKQDTGAPFWIHAGDADLLGTGQRAMWLAMGLNLGELPRADKFLADGEEIRVGAVRLKVLHTPGHSAGSICLYDAANGILFSGDTLFQSSVGRTDLGGSMSALLGSIREKLLPLPNSTIVYPGHGPATTIGEEKMLNPFIRGLEEGKAFV